ncbi:hypothetical protein ACFL47_08760 [Candidatus Latescibacterota bacterium]
MARMFTAASLIELRGVLFSHCYYDVVKRGKVGRVVEEQELLRFDVLSRKSP